MSNIVDTLTEMGFSKERVEVAVKETGSKDVQVVMDWLLSHESNEFNIPSTENENANAHVQKQDDDNPENSIDNNASGQDKLSDSDIPALAKSIRCDDCGKLFKTTEEVEFHASKSGHENFSESTEEKRPLTDEEKKEQLAKIEAKLKQRRLERESKEKEEALLREKHRIKSGKELLEAKKKHEEIEMKKIIEQRKREKEEEKLARQRIREQIEQDKLARRAKFGMPAEESANDAAAAAPVPIPIPVATAPKPQVNYSEVKLQIRLPDGSGLTETFGAKEPLSAVRLFIEMRRNNSEGPFNLMTNFPKKIFESDDYDKPLDSLGLAPSAVLIVKKN